MTYELDDEQLTLAEEIQRIRDLSNVCGFDFEESSELLELLALSVPNRIRMVANDVLTKTDRYRGIDFFNLGAALDVDFYNIICDDGYAWGTYCYAYRYSFDEYVDQCYVLEDLLPAAAKKLDPAKFPRLILFAETEEYPDPTGLSTEEKNAIALAYVQNQVEDWGEGYDNFFSTFCVSHDNDELWFGAAHGGGGGPSEAQWNELWSPYDYRDNNGFTYLDPDLYVFVFLNDC